MVFDEESIFQKKSETEDKEPGGALDSSADTQEKGVKFSEHSKRPDGSEEVPQFQMETNKRLLKSNLDH